MCIAIPMRIVTANEFVAQCERHGAIATISLLLVGPQPTGTHLLTHLGSAIRVLDADEARAIDDALAGLVEASEGRAFEPLFADLISREPELPPHLRTE
ncbi:MULTISPECIES: HypC/HybG/HupF family hydrogenase formation chaperone [Sinorhizobium]|uniref:Hydrogenase n=1 Tax=Sinorhizobium americanum TaxID=194963 RepID=A0A2S3YT09_9HYPH|nr:MULTISPECIES: HypC/HybG/HupF family hydrogenase formation chaperone [Sinorhizobium]PDT36626.1 HypC/HybG/HupF family hydrogenase formation chaperone [Sinorhizobium sp. FG01]PDT49949.1 HypC/HybG/HupF family hydrogenase formation chaperone [Sinorhizobium sp. NG07B]POH33553.1 hydrogenase [Sinorhizobium americanum]POH34770.1 hydrogenase [Sinorhizobium americanum]WOS67143.1 HypC/HybG/HupF family hydrogenase formation chaperone [Sinorhizobium fredii GR64]